VSSAYPDWSEVPIPERGPTSRPSEWIASLPPAQIEAILDRFGEERERDETPREATNLLLEAASGVVARGLMEGLEVEDALSGVGLRAESPLVGLAARMLRTTLEGVRHLGVPGLSDRMHQNRLMHHITYTVLVGGGVNNVPTPECIASHLAGPGKPTPEEIKRAWEECSQ
jgi:hypothetical protein